MTIPSFKKIHINPNSQSQMMAQLDEQNYGQNPFIFFINHLDANERAALNLVEEYIESNSISTYIYPIYIISNITNYKGKLNLISDVKNIPVFFDQKVKPLNVRENSILNKIQLKQNNFNHIEENEVISILDNYGKNHKILSSLKKEGHFLEKLINKLDTLYE